MLLPYVAHVRRASDGDALRPDAARSERFPAFGDELIVDRLDRVERDVGEPRKPGSHQVVAQVGEKHAEGAEMPGDARHDDAAHADLAGDGTGVQGTGAAISDEREGG